MTKRIFLGISKRTYSLIIRDEKTKKITKYPAITLRTGSKHFVILSALFDSLRKLEKNDIAIFYPNDDLISFEWETEHKRDGYFSKGVKDIEKWEEIIKIVKLKNIDLTIKDNNDVLSALGKFKWEV